MNDKIIEALTKRLAEWARESKIRQRDLGRVFDMVENFGPKAKSRWQIPEQRPLLYLLGLRAQPWWRTSDFDWVATVERRGEEIAAECTAAVAHMSLGDHPEGMLVEGGAWKILPLISYGHKHAKNCASIPNTTQILEDIPGAAQASLVYLSSVEPRTFIKPHYGPTNCRLRCHIGITIPGDCWISVGGERRSWEHGKCSIFDDSFRHEVWNGSDQRRRVLIVDFWHPDLSTVECLALQVLTDCLKGFGLIEDR